MRPIYFEHSNGMVGGEVPVTRGHGIVLSLWKASWWERLEILLFGTIWLAVKGDEQPPILLSGNRTFRIDDSPVKVTQ